MWYGIDFRYKLRRKEGEFKDEGVDSGLRFNILPQPCVSVEFFVQKFNGIDFRYKLRRKEGEFKDEGVNSGL
jgi:hypothetical protein